MKEFEFAIGSLVFKRELNENVIVRKLTENNIICEIPYGKFEIDIKAIAKYIQIKEKFLEEIKEIFHKYCSGSTDMPGCCIIPSDNYDKLIEELVYKIIRLL